MLQGDLEASASASGGYLSPVDHMRSVVQHSIQAALGAEQCHGLRLAQALKVTSLALLCVLLCGNFSCSFRLWLRVHHVWEEWEQFDLVP